MLEKEENETNALDGTKVKRAIGFPNGMLMVFDHYGQQIPEFQGRTIEMIPKLRAAGFIGAIESGEWP